MKKEIFELIDSRAEKIARAIRKRRYFISAGLGLSSCTSVFVLALCFHLPLQSVVWIVLCTFISLMFTPVVGTYAGVFYLRNLIKNNRMVEARKFSQQLLNVCLTLFPYSGLFSAATLRMDIMRRDASYQEMIAMSKLLSGAIQRFPYSKWTKSRLLPIFENAQGLARLEMGEYEEAHKLFSGCVPGSYGLNKAFFLNNMGVCDLQLHNYENAYKNFAQAIANVPMQSRAQVTFSCLNPNMARACIRLSRLDEAKALLEQSKDYYDGAKEDNLFRSSFYGSLGLLKVAEGHMDEAEQHFRSALGLQNQFDELSPGMQETRLELANVLEKLGKEEEAAALRRLVDENILKLQLRLEDASDELFLSLSAGTHPMLSMAK